MRGFGAEDTRVGPGATVTRAPLAAAAATRDHDGGNDGHLDSGAHHHSGADREDVSVRRFRRWTGRGSNKWWGGAACMTQYRSYPGPTAASFRRRIRHALYMTCDLVDYVIRYWSYPHSQRAPFVRRRLGRTKQAVWELIDYVRAILDDSPKLCRFLRALAYVAGSTALLVFVFYGDGGRG